MKKKAIDIYNLYMYGDYSPISIKIGIPVKFRKVLQINTYLDCTTGVLMVVFIFKDDTGITVPEETELEGIF